MRARVWVAELPAASFRRRHSRLTALRNQTRLVFGYGSENVDGEAIRQRHVHRNEVDAAFNQTRNKRHASRQAVEAGNDELRPVYSA